MANRVNPINPADVNMKVNIAGVEFNNPVTVASGTFGSGMEYCEYVDLNKLGAVTTKGVANVPWPGNPTPRIAETYGGMINAIGLQNPGLDTFVKRDIPFLKQYDTKIIVNVCGKTEEDYVDAVEKLGEQPVDMLEINISCPNVKEGGIAFGQVPASAERITKAVKNLVVQPTHLMHGAEYDELVETLDNYKDKFETVTVAEPMLGEVGSDATVINEDKAKVAEAITAEAVKTAGYDSLDAAKEDGTAFVFMGHGTSHSAKVSYSQMAAQMKDLSYDNVFIGTVEGEPEETACENVIEAVKEAGYTKVVLRPLMVVAGDHANNDMAGDDEDSWKSQFTASGYFDSVDTQISGLGRIEAIQQIYIDHTKDAIDSLGNLESTSTTESTVGTLEDGVYTAKFDTDSSMFHVNEADEGRGILTVENGKMTIHISLVSKKIVNLFVGTADDAKKDGADILEPTTDTVKYSDGTTDEVYGFDVPVEALDEEFDLAILGTKGEWYDHKVSVSDPQETDN